MQQGTDLALTNTGFFATVRDRIAAWRRVPPPDSDTGLKAKIGKEAIQAKLADAQRKKTDTPLSYQDIAPLRIFNGLLEPAETLMVDTWLSELTGSKAGAITEHANQRKAPPRRRRS